MPLSTPRAQFSKPQSLFETVVSTLQVSLMSGVATCPVEECTLTVDVVLESSDGVLFGAHQRNLETYTEGFPIPGSAMVSGQVSLQETAEILRLILRYTHNVRVPRLDEISFDFLASLAEAVEKYMIYSAMEFCRVKMENAMGDHPNEIFVYSVKHNYPDLADKAAKLTLRNPASGLLASIQKAGLRDDIALRWFRYHDRWMETLVQLPVSLTTHDDYSNSEYCSLWEPFQLRVFEAIRHDLGALDRFLDIINNEQGTLSRCPHCRLGKNSWALEVKEKIKNLPQYSEA